MKNPDKLFSKFATKSDTGSGLGLYIPKALLRLIMAGYGLRITQMEKEVQHLHSAYQSLELGYNE